MINLIALLLAASGPALAADSFVGPTFNGGQSMVKIGSLLEPVNACFTTDGAGAYKRLLGEGGSVTANVTASTLPTGAATAAKQDTGNASLSSIDGKVATEATLSTRASEANLSTRASETTLSTRASEANLSTRASNANLSTRLSEATGAVISATLSTRLSETTGAAIASSTAASAFALDVLLSSRASDANLSTRLSETTGAATAASVASIDSDIDVKISTRASEANLSTRMSDATGQSILTALQGLQSDANFTTLTVTYTATTQATTMDVSASPMKYYSLQVGGDGAVPGAWDVRLECALNPLDNYTLVLQHSTVTGDGVTLASTGVFPCLYLRTRVAGLTLGTATDIFVSVVGTK